MNSDSLLSSNVISQTCRNSVIPLSSSSISGKLLPFRITSIIWQWISLRETIAFLLSIQISLRVWGSPTGSNQWQVGAQFMHIPPGKSCWYRRAGDSWYSSKIIHPRYRGWSGSNKERPPMGLTADSFECDVTRLIRGLWFYFRNQIAQN